ncbi:unnamed protein product [Moneuplotes crassus]|uniref:14-3-3 domain-containing protein n=1 Tax=Euplotes crassus TaxID=5936 RepID=A0AAD1XPF0_EUPCR|nr:unnamed protein product [Moneuplotes crassus]
MEEGVFMVRVAAQAERYEDAVDLLTKALQLSQKDASPEVVELLSATFKDFISSERSAWKTVKAIEQNKKYAEYAPDLAEYKDKISLELDHKCRQVIDIIQEHCLSKATTDDSEGSCTSKVFYLKLVGDNYRYIAETASGPRRDKAIEKADSFYRQATDFSKALHRYNSSRLGCGLNYSVFWYEIMEDKSKALQIAEEALEERREYICQDDSDEVRDSLPILELLRENIDIWKEGEDSLY